MSFTTQQSAQLGGTTDAAPFDLDIRVIETSGEAASLISLTDDGCGSTCPNACATNMG